MTTGELKQAVKRHRSSAYLGIVAGILLIVGWFAYDMMQTPDTPQIGRAPAAEIVAYVGNARGYARLTQIEQEQFLDRWREFLINEGGEEELNDCLDGMDESDRKAFAAAILKHAKRSFIEDARRYARQSTPQEKNAYLREKLEHYQAQARFTKRVASSFRGEAPKNQDQLQQWVIEHTTAEERALGEPYLDALKRVREIVRKEQGAPAPAQPANS
jgi:hypothetical protein